MSLEMLLVRYGDGDKDKGRIEQQWHIPLIEIPTPNIVAPFTP